ncbi:MAG TPA: ABC transporter permease [Chitinophagaceae bacterium]|nr:ABC transporter permease [Chitinophagaceae bacterium]
MLLVIAWRNIWRNKRRTLITSGSVFFAIILAVIMRSSTDGAYEGMINNVVSFSSGYIQLHKKGYWEEHSIENALKIDNGFFNKLELQKGIAYSTPRLESFALASANAKTKGLAFIGIDPEKEMVAAKIHEKVKQGTYFKNENDNGIVIGQGVAEYFKVGAGDSLVVISQGYHASSAAAIFPVRGIVFLGSPQLNNSLVYLTLENSRRFLSADSLCTSVSIYLNDINALENIANDLRNVYSSDLIEVMTWKEMMPEVDQFIVADRSGHFIVIGILYLVISFGLYGTVLMMTYERRHEFGILVSIGMKKIKLMWLVFFETLFVTFFGAILGMMSSFLLILYFHYNPIEFTGQLKEVYQDFGMDAILSFSIDPSIFYYQAFTVFLLALVVSIYPSLKILIECPLIYLIFKPKLQLVYQRG